MFPRLFAPTNTFGLRGRVASSVFLSKSKFIYVRNFVIDTMTGLGVRNHSKTYKEGRDGGPTRTRETSY